MKKLFACITIALLIVGAAYAQERQVVKVAVRFSSTADDTNFQVRTIAVYILTTYNHEIGRRFRGYDVGKQTRASCDLSRRCTHGSSPPDGRRAGGRRLPRLSLSLAVGSEK